MLKSTSTIFLSFHHLIKPISSSQQSSVISLLQEGYSLHQIQSKTDLGKSTVGRIKKEVDSDKENYKILPSSPLVTNKPFFAKSLLESLIMLSRLPITSTTLFPPLFLLQQSGELSRKTIFTLLLNRNDLFSRRLIVKLDLNLPSIMPIEQKRIGRGSCGQMRQR